MTANDPTRDEARRIVQELIQTAEDEGETRTVEFLEGMQDTLAAWKGCRITDRMIESILNIYKRLQGHEWSREPDGQDEQEPAKLRLTPLQSRQASAMAPSEFQRRMATIVLGDDLAEHIAADELLCCTLRQLGYGDGIDEYEERFSLQAAQPQDA